MVREVYLVGVGMGNPDTLTVEARDAIRRSALIIGSARLLEPFLAEVPRALALTRADDIVQVLRAEAGGTASVLFSGDVGFYSGATSLAQKLAEVPGVQVKAVPGISSLAYFCARLLVPWQDVFLASAHGRECDVVGIVAAHAKAFFLTGGPTKAHDVCRMLADAGLGDVDVSVGERLSYCDEAIARGSAAQLAQRRFSDLAVVLVRNPAVVAEDPGRPVQR